MRSGTLLLTGLAALLAAGCAGWSAPPSGVGAELPAPNPMFVPAVDPEFLHNQLVDELDNYFRVHVEERLTAVTPGRIETHPKVGSTFLEPWGRDSRPGFERWHATLQSIRRRAVARVSAAEAGYFVEVRVFKELEDLSQPENSSVGAATFRANANVETFDQDQPTPELPPGSLGWIPQGRDPALEQHILRGLRGRLNLKDW